MEENWQLCNVKILLKLIEFIQEISDFVFAIWKKTMEYNFIIYNYRYNIILKIFWNV